MAKPKTKKKNNGLAGQVRKIESAVKAAISPVALVAPGVGIVMQKGLNASAIAPLCQIYTGYNPESGKFTPESLLKGWGAYAMTKVIKKGLRMIGG